MRVFEFSFSDKLRGFDLKFETTYDLFSYKGVDKGTRLLADSIAVDEGDICLDLGCGYGSLGIVMAKLNPTGKIYLVDRDFVGVKFAETNCKLNGVTNSQVKLSNGFSELSGIKFDVIASNLPSHQAKLALKNMIYCAFESLNRQGRFFVVIVSRLKNYIRKELEMVFDAVEKLSQDSQYAVFLAIKK